jgi:peptide/nickel transport system permease protein
LDPVLAVVNRLSAYGAYYDPVAFEKMISALKKLYGLEGTLWDQYTDFWRRLSVGDFGPSLNYFPMPAVDIVYNALPWTVGLLSLSTLLSWFVGNVVGAFAGYYSDKRWTRVLEVFAISVYPIPYYVMALVLVLIFTYLLPIFPSFGGVSIGVKPSLSIEYFSDIISHALLPALSLVIVGYGWWFLSMKMITNSTRFDDYVVFGEIMNLPNKKLFFNYIMRNSLLPQVTGLSMSLSSIFSGALVTEVVFSYPGVGYVLYVAVTSGDFNLMMAITTYSIIAVASAMLLIDLIYPLIDPRIRYG